ncbi:MAG: hypothetical protein M0R05_01505 [Bacilli bacterium]|nr:hypothetical protein [Bacilli bacterium]
MKKLIIFIFIIYIVFAFFSLRINAAYNYGPFGEVVASAEALIAQKVVDSSNLTDTDGKKCEYVFGELVDVFAYQNRVFLVDKSNNCVVVLDDEFRYLTTFGLDEETGKLKKPNGIFVTADYIYVADTENKRVAIFNHDYEFAWEITTPDDPSFKQNPEDKSGYDFKPLKITVNSTGRIYVVAEQIFEGIIDFNPDGSFSRYIGASTITLSVWDAFWLYFTTEAQRKAQGYRLATSFVNVNVDAKGHLYTLSGLSEGRRIIKKLNNKGHDIMWRNGYVAPVGDVIHIGGRVKVPTGPSQLVDIDINDYGNYCVLDKTRGRIFVYDFEGYLLYIGGQLGNIGGTINNQSSLFLSPEALCFYRENILVVDSLNKNLIVMGYTEFAHLVNQATEHYYYGEYQAAKEVWEDVLIHNTNYYRAYSGIGKAELREGDYRRAMVNLKLGYDDYNYSKAYKQYRYQKMTVIFPYVAAAVLALAVYLIVRSIKVSVQREKEEEKDE